MSDSPAEGTTAASRRPGGAGLEGQPPRARPLADLLGALSGDVRPGHAAETVVTGIVSRAEDVEPGCLFVALPGESADGHAFIADAARRKAAAIIVERDVGGALDVPMVRVANARRALAEVAAEWHGHPADRMVLIGITGTAGKTSTLSLLETVLVAGGVRAGSIGSLGLHIQGEVQEKTVYTTPDPLVLHGELARLEAAGCEIVVMEATSHALTQDRVHGLRYGLGIFTNLLPLEHSEYHDTFQDYVEAKSRFFELLAPDAPVVYNRDDPVTRELVEDSTPHGLAVGTASDAYVRILPAGTTTAGSRLTLRWDAPLPRRDGSAVARADLDLRLRLLGPANGMNAALAATAALWAGIEPHVVTSSLADVRPPPRRLQVVHRGRFTILDDTVGHPDSISAFFDVVTTLAPRRCHLAYAIRGHRGKHINRANGEALAIWAERLAIETLVVTRSAEAADELNRVEEEEYEAFLAPLRHQGLSVLEADNLETAVHTVLERAAEGDLVALLGAQGMDGGQELARAWLSERLDSDD